MLNVAAIATAPKPGSTPTIHDAHGTIVWWNAPKGYGVMLPASDTAKQVDGRLYYSAPSIYGGEMGPDRSFGSSVPKPVYFNYHVLADSRETVKALLNPANGLPITFDARLTTRADQTPIYALENVRIVRKAASFATVAPQVH